jgi:Glycerophosphoryl diester phosphodiesterase family
MRSHDSLIDHLLSHRLRGFDDVESTRLGLERGLKAGVRNVEFDVRVTRDGCPIAYHDPFFLADDGNWSFVDQWDFAALRSQRSLARIATLEDMCRCFSDFQSPDALLHVDVKVSGFESVIRDTIAKFGLLSNTVLVSWLPDVLVRFHSISPQTRLCFSHLSLARAPWLYNAAKTIFPIVERATPIIGKGMRGLAPVLANQMLAVRLYFYDNGDAASGHLYDSDAHTTPGCVVPTVLTGGMLELLRRTNGMVCMPLALATRRLREDYRSLGVQFAVYSVADIESLKEVMARIDPDIVYVDNAEVIREAAAASETPHSDVARMPSTDREPGPARFVG